MISEKNIFEKNIQNNNFWNVTENSPSHVEMELLSHNCLLKYTFVITLSTAALFGKEKVKQINKVK
jgi:hypothetical protein